MELPNILHYRGHGNHPTGPRGRKLARGMQTASQKCPAEEKPRASHGFLGPEGRSRLSEEGLQQLREPKGEKSTMVGRRLDQNKPGQAPDGFQ